MTGGTGTERAAKLDDIASQLTPSVIGWRRHFHRTPELGWLEYGTTAHIAEILDGWGFDVRVGNAVTDPEARLGVPSDAERADAWQAAFERGASRRWLEALRTSGTGVIAEYDTGEPGPLTAIRCDIDALPLREATHAGHRASEEGWASENHGCMHACGHDGHIAILLGVASAVSNLGILSRGRLRLLFQPAEEGARGGAAAMKAGAVDGVDHLLCYHLGLGVPTGAIVGGAVRLLATTRISCEFHGRAAHAGLEPEAGRHSLLAAAQAAIALHTLPQHSGGTARVNVGVLRAGSSENIIPGSAILRVQTRGETSGIDEHLRERAGDVIRGAARMYGCDVDLQVIGQAVAADSSPDLAEFVTDEAAALSTVGDAARSRAFGASEDASFLMRAVQDAGGQATYVMIGSDLSGGHHTSEFDFDENSLTVGVRLLCGMLDRLAG